VSRPVRRRILVTGASSGLGEGMARRFAAMGRDLALAARRTDRLEALRDELVAAHPGVTVSVHPLDVTDHAAVFATVKAAAAELGGLDRVVVNAGIGKGARLGTGRFDANLATVETNLVAALAQVEAALEVFREQRSGHLVLVSSMSAMRGLPGSKTAYSASKAGLSALGEGLRAELGRGPIRVTTLHPGYIRTDLNAKVAKTPLMSGTEAGVDAMVAAVEREPASACVPAWPWTLVGVAMRVLPVGVVGRMG